MFISLYYCYQLLVSKRDCPKAITVSSIHCINNRGYCDLCFKTTTLFFSAQRKKNKFKSQEEKKDDENAILRKVIEENADIKGGYEKPKITDVLWIQMFVFPYHILM